MSFFWPHAFWLLLLPIGFLVAELTRRVRTSAARHPKIIRAEASPTGLQMSAGGTLTSAMPKVRWRLWIGLALVVTALARPQWGEIDEPVFEQAREILIAVDLSKSMLAPDVPPTRLDRAKLLITGLLDRLEGERVGLAVFAGTAFLQSPMSSDYEILQEFLPALDPTFLPEGGTEYASLLDTALDSFSTDANADRFLIVLSDGESQTEAWRQRLATLRDRGIRVISLGVGTTEGSMLPDGEGGFIKDERGAVVMSRLNPSTLEELARSTSGAYRDASAWVDLADLLTQTVEMGRAGEFTESRQARRIERFQWALGPGLLILLWSLWREFPVRPRQRAIAVRPRSAAATASTALMIVLGLGLSIAPKQSHAQPSGIPPGMPTEEMPDFGAPVAELIGELAGQDSVVATEFADLAEATLAWGNQLLQIGQPITESVVYDALDGVDLGESLDEAAADWPTLRDELEKLLEQSQHQQDQQDQGGEDGESEDQEQNSDQNSDEDSESGENGEQQDQEGDQGEDGEQGQDGEQREDGEQGENGQEGDSGDSEEQSEGSNGDSENEDQEQNENGESGGSPEQEDPTEEQRRNAERAFDEDQPSPEQPQPQQPPQPQPQQQPQPDPGNQSVGGQQVQDREAAENPELAVPLQKLDQLKDGDSPARLYQLMQDPDAQPPKSGRDW